MKTKMALHMLRVELPLEVIDEINSHIDETTIRNAEDASKGLVGHRQWDEKGRGWAKPGQTPWIPEDMASAAI